MIYVRVSTSTGYTYYTFYVASVHSRILNILITGSLFHFPLDYRRYLHVVAAPRPAFASILPRDSFSSRRACFSLARARFMHFRSPAKRVPTHSGSHSRYFPSYYCPVLTTGALGGYASVRACGIPRNFEISFAANVDSL